MPLINPPFLIHTLLELPACLNFFIRPNEQLSCPAPQAHALIRQYAVLLMSSNIIALTFAFREVDGIGRRVAGALALYHVAPLVRAVWRIGGRGERRVGEGTGEEKYGKGLGGSWVHGFVHAGALAALAWLAVGW